MPTEDLDAPLAKLVVATRMALQRTQTAFGHVAVASRKTVGRWERGWMEPDPASLRRMATAVHTIDRALADALATAAGTTLQAMGLVAPQAPGVAPGSAPVIEVGPPPLPPRARGDLVVFAAAEALDAPPAAARPAVRAAFEQAESLGLSVADVLAALDAARDGTQ